MGIAMPEAKSKIMMMLGQMVPEVNAIIMKNRQMAMNNMLLRKSLRFLVIFSIKTIAVCAFKFYPLAD